MNHMPMKNFVEYLERHTAKWPRRYIRYLFGSAGFFYGPRLFLFVMGDSFGIKVPEAARKTLLKQRGVRPFFNAGKPFGRWLEVPIPRSERGFTLLQPYIKKAYQFARGTIKTPKPRR